MNTEKKICNELKTLRRQIAQENGIPLEIPECHYEGPCPGSCPRCDAELRYLEQALQHRSRLGKAALVAGVALGLAAGQSVMAQEPVTPKPLERNLQAPDSCHFTGVVQDSRNHEPMAFCNVRLLQDGKLIAGAVTDFDGAFTLHVPYGDYLLKLTHIGYEEQKMPLKLRQKKHQQNIELVFNMPSLTLGLIEATTISTNPRNPSVRIGETTSGSTYTSDEIEHFPTP